MAENLTLTLVTSALAASILIFSLLYYYRLRAISREYLEARGVIGGIVITFKNRYDKLSSDLQQLRTQISETRSTTQEAVRATAQLGNDFGDAVRNLEQTKSAYDGVLSTISTLQQEVTQLKEAQETLQSKISSSQTPSMAEAQSASSKDDAAPNINSGLTETENMVLLFLLSEGPKTAGEVEEKIGKTREHTARLMKKLWQEGYVERETHKIPFTYRAARALRNLESPSA